MIGTPLPEPPDFSQYDFRQQQEYAGLWVQGFNDGFQEKTHASFIEESTSVSSQSDYLTILYKLARLCRNTDMLFPSTWGYQVGQLLVKLRILNGKRYDQEVIEPLPKD